MSSNWVLLSSYKREYQSALLAAALEERGIQYKMVDKVDSAFTFMGEIEVYVRRSEFVTARRLKEKLENNE